MKIIRNILIFRLYPKDIRINKELTGRKDHLLDSKFTLSKLYKCHLNMFSLDIDKLISILGEQDRCYFQLWDGECLIVQRLSEKFQIDIITKNLKKSYVIVKISSEYKILSYSESSLWFPSRRRKSFNTTLDDKSENQDVLKHLVLILKQWSNLELSEFFQHLWLEIH